MFISGHVGRSLVVLTDISPDTESLHASSETVVLPRSPLHDHDRQRHVLPRRRRGLDSTLFLNNYIRSIS